MKIASGLGLFLAGGLCWAGQDAFQGTWKVVAAIDKGDKVSADDLKLLEISFDGDKVLVREGDKVQERMSFKVDAGKKPAAIDITHIEGPKKGQTDLGIFAFAGKDSLTICVNEKKGGDRPREIASPQGSTFSLIVLKKAK